MIVLYGCALVTLAARTLLEGAYHDYLSAALYTFAFAATALLIHTIVTWIRNLWHHWRTGRSTAT